MRNAFRVGGCSLAMHRNAYIRRATPSQPSPVKGEGFDTDALLPPG
ncbi:hypothetical protein FHS78_002060 [Parvibaculum indicum]|nr:hypothetical protein [Parvibaculum indicum]